MPCGREEEWTQWALLLCASDVDEEEDADDDAQEAQSQGMSSALQMHQSPPLLALTDPIDRKPEPR